MTAMAMPHASPPPPKGTTPILWQLLTTLPVTSAAEALERVRWYAQRWQIEVLHKVLKSGCKVEQRQLETALTGTITALGRMTETRDPYTAGHQIHVGALAEKIALQLGLDTKTAALIRQSGELHDVGKIAVPAEILTRPGRLTDLDFAIIKRHTTVGSDILSKASLPLEFRITTL